MVDLAQNANLIEDLVSAFGVSELCTLDGDGGSVLESSFVYFAVATDTEEAVAGEVVGGFFYLFACEEFCGSASASRV